MVSYSAPMVSACDASAPPAANPGVRLGVVIGEAARSGRDKLTIIASPGIADVGAWLEQLLAESTGKCGRGLIHLAGEPLTTPGSLTAMTAEYHPGDVVTIDWVGVNGAKHASSITLGSGPAH